MASQMCISDFSLVVAFLHQLVHSSTIHKTKIYVDGWFLEKSGRDEMLKEIHSNQLITN